MPPLLGLEEFVHLLQHFFDALADSFWQLLMLHGAIGDAFEPELLSYEVPTYFGMLCAVYTTAAQRRTGAA